MLNSLAFEMALGSPTEGSSAKAVVRRLSDVARGSLRWAGYLPYFKVASGLVLTEALSTLAVVFIGLSYAVFCHSIRDCLASHSRAQRETMVSIKGATVLFILLNISAPTIAFVFSPESFGAFIETPHEVLPAFALLVAPCCLGFGIAQRHRLSHARLLYRLGLSARLR